MATTTQTSHENGLPNPLLVSAPLSTPAVNSDFIPVSPAAVVIPRPRNQIIRRLFDVIVASFALVVFFIPMLLICILVLLDSRGPIFYGQERIGYNGRRFRMWKFRSMRCDAEKSTGAVWAIKNDPRRTRVGSFLRVSSLDELPQLYNVFRGEMSIVGPRPERPHFVEEFSKEMPLYPLRHQVPVGITGWAQVNGWRGGTSLQRRLDYDLFYIRNQSLWLDIKILFMTLFRGFIHPNAY